MDAEDRPPDHSLAVRIRERPQEFAFFEAVRLLELAKPEAVLLGREGPAREEAVRLRPSSSLAFQAGELTKFEHVEDSVELMTVTLLGLYGANSPLPGFYSTDILEYETVNAGEPDPVRLFLDVINHRLLSLLYRAWSKYRWGFTFRSGATDDISRAVFALCGIGDRADLAGFEISPQRLLRYAGFATQKPASAQSIARAVSDFFDGVPVRIEQCVERWAEIHPDDQNRLGMRNAVLGGDFVLGESIVDRSGRFRLEIGPFQDLATYDRFTTHGRNLRDLASLVRFLLGDPIDYDVVVGLEEKVVPETRLASDSKASRLGSTSWLCTETATTDKWEQFTPPDLDVAA